VRTFDRFGIAERLRGLIGGQDGGDIAKSAARLRVEELSLRMSVDELSPHPTVEVLTAVISAYGIDPTWLLTGEYDSSSHRTAIEEGPEASGAMREFVLRQVGRIAEPPNERQRPESLN